MSCKSDFLWGLIIEFGMNIASIDVVEINRARAKNEIVDLSNH